MRWELHGYESDIMRAQDRYHFMLLFSLGTDLLKKNSIVSGQRKHGINLNDGRHLWQ